MKFKLEDSFTKLALIGPHAPLAALLSLAFATIKDGEVVALDRDVAEQQLALLNEGKLPGTPGGPKLLGVKSDGKYMYFGWIESDGASPER